MSGRVTIAQVAEDAGVSAATVSKVLNGVGQLRPQTRARVFASARRLGFRSAYIRRDSGLDELLTIGVLTSDSYGRFTIPLMLGAEDAFGAGKVSVLMCDARDDPIREEFYLNFLTQRRVDGVIVTGKSTDPRPSLGKNHPFPLIYAYQPSEDERDTSIVPDHYGVARLAVDHLIGTGRRRIAHITGPERHTVVRERVRGAVAALSQSGLELTGPPFLGEWSEAWGRMAATLLVRDHPEVDGIFCASDELARGAVSGLREAGVEVPSEVAVVGVDNWSVLAEASRPPLTTVDLELRQLGIRASQMLGDQILGTRKLPRGTQVFPGTLVRRESA